jgi:hypothetical protein
VSDTPIDDGGPAFPTVATATTHGFYADGQPCMTHYGSRSGISVRDYFAAAALQALISSRSCTSFDEAAFSAYEAANEMIAFRKQDE